MKTRELKLGKEHLTFILTDENGEREEISVHTGYKYLINTFVKGDIPSEAEVERASNYFEDEIMKDKKLVNHNEALIINSDEIADIFGIKETKTVTKAEFEFEFNKYADFVEGEPEHILGIEFTLEKFVQLYIVRDILYYLKFSEIVIVQ